MNIPGFGAESSLGPAMGMYMGKSVHFWTNRGFVAGIASISPQQLSLLGTFPETDCFGDLKTCIRVHCLDVPDGRCRAACAQPAVCGPCRCTCSPDCTRTCERECRKSVTGADLKCTQPCSL
jgi:hypothetical protein